MASPSFLHEGLIRLVRDRPAFAAELVRKVLGVKLPKFAEATLTDATLSDIAPKEYRPDSIVIFKNPKPVHGIIFEAQLEPDPNRIFKWPSYAHLARDRYHCPFDVLVTTPNRAAAKWASQPIRTGRLNTWSALVVGPDGIPAITKPVRPRTPQLSVLSALAHGKRNPKTAASIALAAFDAVAGLPDEQRLLYLGLVESALSVAARKALEMIPEAQKFFSESQRLSFDKGRTEGKAEGTAETKAADVVAVLESRGIRLSSAQRQRILDCAELATLDQWIRKAALVTTAEELFAERPARRRRAKG